MDSALLASNGGYLLGVTSGRKLVMELHGAGRC